jgi:serine/threonine protein kinase/formylglycine-generating enzyme required for sulfatase activity
MPQTAHPASLISLSKITPSIPMAAERWGDYEVDLTARLGGGGMGTLYRARQISVDRPVALKVLASELSSDPDFTAQFEAEARLAANLAHPHIVAVYGAGAHEGRRYIAFELVNGIDLSRYLERRQTADHPLQPPELLGLLLQAISALAVAHAAGVVHRDLKPSNMLLSDLSPALLAGAALGPRLARRILKISDFGIATGPVSHGSNLGLGSPLYASPEQLDGERGDARSDLYSLSIVAFELLTGRPPFKGTIAEVMAGHLLSPIEIPKSVDPELREVLHSCLAKDPAQRPPDASALIAPLTSIGIRLESLASADPKITQLKLQTTPLKASPSDSTNEIPAARSDTVFSHDSSHPGSAETVLIAPPAGSSDSALERRHSTSRVRRLEALVNQHSVLCGADHELFPSEPLGQGGMGTVFLGRQISLDRPVAVKVLRMDSQAAKEGRLRARFERESRLAGRLQHPNIVSVLAAGIITDPRYPDFDGLPYYAMELVQGEDLKDRIRREPRLSLEDSLGIIEQVALGLSAAADLDLVHRDIKPDNIILSEDAGGLHVKIADFGLAKDLSSETMTATGTVLGSVAYLAPEQIAGKVDPRADLYALGITWFEMLTGELPFREATVSAMLKAHQSKPPPRLKGFPDRLADAVSRCLAKSPSDRFASARDLLTELRQLRREVLSTPSAPIPAPPPPSLEDTTLLPAPRRRQGSWLAASLTSILLSSLAITLISAWAQDRRELWLRAIVFDLRDGRCADAERRLKILAENGLPEAINEGLREWLNIEKRVEELTRRCHELAASDNPSPNEISGINGELRAQRKALGATRNLLLSQGIDIKDEVDAAMRRTRELGRALPQPPTEAPIPEGMARVPAADFDMGPIPTRLSAFDLDLHEVTWRNYRAFLTAIAEQGHKNCHHLEAPSKDHQPSALGLEQSNDDLPVTGVDWFDAYAYAQWAGKRLPTEAEWQQAASPKGQPFPWGARFEDLFPRADDARSLAPPGSRPKDRGAFGHLDLAANVREWCADYFEAWPDSRTDRRIDPQGPATGSSRVIRGGSWALGDAADFSALHRGRARPETRAADLGFRCAKDIPSQTPR